MQKFTKKSVAESYCKKHPTMSTRGLAQKLYEDHPDLYSSYELARTDIRVLRGQMGVFNRVRNKNNVATFTESSKKKLAEELNLPEYIEVPYEAYHLPLNSKGGIIADLHVPYTNKQALETSLKYFKKIGINWLLINGDFIDFYMVSPFQTDPRCRNVKTELEFANTTLDIIQKYLPKVKIILKQGNHDRRYSDYVMRKAPELFEVFSEYCGLETVLKLFDRGIDYVADKRQIYAGELTILHGDELGRGISAPVNPARMLYLKTNVNTACAHYHQISQHSKPTMRGKNVSCWSIGCLCDLHPQYAPINNWEHGFATVDLDDVGKFVFSNYRVINGSVM